MYEEGKDAFHSSVPQLRLEAVEPMSLDEEREGDGSFLSVRGAADGGERRRRSYSLRRR